MTRAVDWQVQPVEVAAPQALLDGGLALLEQMATDPRRVLRWYRATTTAVVLGRGQHLPAAGGTPPTGGPGAPGDVQVLTRHSGGGAVLLDPSLLSLDVVLPAGDPWLDGDLARVFDHVGQAWRTGLSALGVADLAVHPGPGTARRRGTERERLLAAVCYATLGRGEVLADGRKLVGLAQRRRRHGALVQCGLLRRWAPGPLLGALGADPDDAEIARAAVGLDDLGHGDLSEGTIVDAVSTAFAQG